MKNVFVVGGAGFIGSAIVRELLSHHEVELVTVYDNLSSGTRSRLSVAEGSGRFVFIEGNARDFDKLRVAMIGHDTVFHLAANPDIAKAVKEPTIDFEQGTVITQNVLEAMRVNNVGQIIYLSGSGVYGDRADVWMDEETPCEPISTYGASKLASEGMISAYCSMFEMSARVFRPANIVGPRQTHGVGMDFIRKLKADPTKLQILGDGTQRKSYIHVDDVIDAINDVLAWSNQMRYIVFNLASDDTIDVTSIARLACKALGIEPGKVEFLYGTGDRGWKGDVPKVNLDTGFLRKTGWRPSSSSTEAMRAALESLVKEL